MRIAINPRCPIFRFRYSKRLLAGDFLNSFLTKATREEVEQEHA